MDKSKPRPAVARSKDIEAGKRFDDTLRRMLSTPPKPHDTKKLPKQKFAK